MNTNRIFISLPIILFSIVLTACGGGGDGPPPITYSGVSTPADLKATNATELSTSAAHTGGAFGDAGQTASTAPGSQQRKSGTLIIAQAAVRAIQAELNANLNPNPAIGAVLDETEAGPCGGSLHINLNFDESKSMMTGTLSFNDYCEDGETMTGQTSIVGDFDFSAQTMTFTMTMNSMLIRENASGDVYKIENYVLEISADLTAAGDIISMEVRISGRFYDPAYGYILVSTPTLTPLRFEGNSEWPSSGVIEVAENKDPFGKAMLTAVSSTEYKLQLDLDGNGVFEDTIPGLWADL